MFTLHADGVLFVYLTDVSLVHTESLRIISSISYAKHSGWRSIWLYTLPPHGISNVYNSLESLLSTFNIRCIHFLLQNVSLGYRNQFNSMSFHCEAQSYRNISFLQRHIFWQPSVHRLLFYWSKWVQNTQKMRFRSNNLFYINNICRLSELI